MEFNFNTYQTPITEELKESLPREVYSELIDIIEGIQLVSWLIQPEEIRGFAKDRNKDDEGKIIVDVTKPHILENMDYFRQAALHFQKYGAYTLLHPNPNPNSEYKQFWKEEVRRWKEGYIRESDGEWIPGYYYFYLNYCKIWINEEISAANTTKNKKRTKGIRRREFPKVWLGDYLWFHYMDQARNGGIHDDFEGGKHCKLLKKRGCGFSFKFGAITPCSMYINQGLPNFHLASEKTFLEGDKGVFGKVVDCLDWIADNTPMPRLKLVDKPLEKQLGYKDDEGIRRGILSSVFGISMKDDSHKARGIRGPIIQYEEDGVFDNLEDSWNVNREAVEEGGITFGQMIAGGTGGTEGANFIGSEKLFYYPSSYNIYALPNVYDRNADEGKRHCGFFWGAYMNRSRCYDEANGEPDVIKALIEILVDRYEIKYNSPDATALTQKKAEQPITPQEAVLRRDGTIFPIADLKEYLAEIAPNIAGFTASHYVGKMVLDLEGKPKFVEDTSLYPLRDFPLKDGNNTQGAVEIFYKPIFNSNGRTTPLRYIAGIDPIDDDHSTTTSLPSIFIFDTFTEEIVAEYTGRPGSADEFYEVCRRLLMYYGATANYENDKKGLYNYFLRNHSLHLLCDNPEVLEEKNIAKVSGNYGNKKKGTNSSKAVNMWGRRLQRDWMVAVSKGSSETDEEGKPIPPKLNLQKIGSIAYLKEAIAWNPDGNFDRISAMGMLMIYREEVLRYEVRATEEKKQVIAMDNFFARHLAKSAKYKSFSYRKS